MARRFDQPRLVLATHNAGKLAEIRALLAPLGVDVVSSGELGLAEPVEDGDSFAANAALKAMAAVEASGLPALADDSGLEVFGLDGQPGVVSARWAGPDRDFKQAMARVRRELAERFGDFQRADKRARFVAVLCLAWPDGHREFAEGEVVGQLVDPPRGSGGFGYDPMFQPEDRAETFAEMPASEKRTLSHRARAIDRLVTACFDATCASATMS
ncbi:MAG: non-canonical purine NTP pyrophosphatase [Alphaproteobacteria bacterium]|nr:non-canonical purine NTP pyrophosphatase [Alphaproteobacteria bacterium]